MKNKWVSLGLAVSVLATSTLLGCSSDSKDTGSGDTSKPTASKQELNLAISDEVPTMDVSKATNAISFTLFANINEGLVRLDKNGKPESAMAKEWKASDDGLKYTFHLRDGVKWSNGDPVTAHDFEYSWKRTLDPNTKAEYSFMVAWVKGGAAFNDGKGKAEDVKVTAKDDKTLEVELEAPVPFFIEQMAFPIFFPQNKKFVEQHGEKNGADGDKVISNGPFKLTEWNHEQNVVIVKNDSYWDKDKVKLETVTFTVAKDNNAALNLYESGQLDRTQLTREQVDLWKDKSEYTVQPELTTGYLVYNTDKVKALSSKKVRQALTYAVDGDKYADIVLHNGSVGATGYTAKGTNDGQGGDFTKQAGDLIKRKDNVTKAKQLLQDGLKEVGLTEFPKLKVLSDDGTDDKKGAEFIKEQWRQNLGIEIEIETVPYKIRLERTKKHDYDISVYRWGADYNDPMTFLDMYETKSPFNYPHWKNDEYDKLIQQARVETDKKKRTDAFLQAEKILMDEMPVGPLYFRARAFLIKPYVKDFLPRVFGPDYELKHTYIEGK